MRLAVTRPVTPGRPGSSLQTLVRLRQRHLLGLNTRFQIEQHHLVHGELLALGSVAFHAGQPQLLFTQLQFELQPRDAPFELEFHPGNTLIAIEQRPVHAFEGAGHSLPTRSGKLSQGFLDIGTKSRL